MRLKQLGNQWRVYMNPMDFHRLWACAESRRACIAIRLGGECGLRVSETSSVKPGDFRESTDPSAKGHHFLGIYGKDTTGETEKGKFREVFVPTVLYQIIQNEIEEAGYGPDDEIMPVTKRTVQEYIKRAAQGCAERYDNEDYAKISSHDLRAFWATNLLVRHGVNEDVVKDLGGWVSRENMEPYLYAQFDDIIIDEMREAGIEGKTFFTGQRRD